MANFLETVVRSSRWHYLRLDRRGIPPRAFLNPKDFQNGKAPGTAYVAPEYPKFAPPEWQAGVQEYISELECELIFEHHFKNLSTTTWDDFSFEWGKAFAGARAERTMQRRIKRNKRAFHYWSGYVVGFTIAFRLAERFFRHRKP